MKKLTLPLLAAVCMAAVLTPVSASAKDKDKHKKHHDDDRRVESVDRNGHSDGYRDAHSGDRNYSVSRSSNVRVVTRQIREDDGRDYRSYRSGRDDRAYSYRERYPRRVIVYQNRPYGYNYYDLQVVLRREGYYRGPLDGDWGPGSRSALIRYQRDHGWRDDGEVDGRLIVNFNLGY
ncbi:MAG: peptidoglycan-binding domain-containing protein [Chthoniobacterales bacterium]